MRFLIFLGVLFLAVTNLYGQEGELEKSYSAGEKIYLRKCAVCHSKDGLGKGNRIPPLANSDYLFKNQKASIRGIIYGQNEKIIVNGQVYNKKMKAITLSDAEIADVMNFIQNAWGNENSVLVTEALVAKIRDHQ